MLESSEGIAEEFAYARFERVIQCVLLGPVGAGKTAFLRLIAPLLGHHEPLSDVGLNKVSGVQSVCGTALAFRLFDVPGRADVEEPQHAKLLRDADAAIVVCDINDAGSIDEAMHCARQLAKRFPKCARFLLFNRDDGEFDRVVLPDARLQALSRAVGCAYARTSCRERQGIEDALYSLATFLIDPTQTFMFVGAQDDEKTMKGKGKGGRKDSKGKDGKGKGDKKREGGQKRPQEDGCFVL